MKNLVIVESPAKAKTINKYLGKDYVVSATYGHVRDLPSKEGSVDPNNHFKMIWKTDSKSKKYIEQIIKEIKKETTTLYLATDQDREGEAIAWHVSEIIKNKLKLKNIEIKRITFNEVTKKAILESLKNPRKLDQYLIEAYLTRRALDYLVGFTISPILWRKLPGSRSAGRVQSVALRLISDREIEIETFKKQEYWSINVDFLNVNNINLTSKLTHLNKTKLDKFSISNETSAKNAVNEIKKHDYNVSNITKRQINKYPSPPFITSTLQQEAIKKLKFSAKYTMQIAQQLYEGIHLNNETVGLITYIRTDSTHVAQDALQDCRKFITSKYGKDYLPDKPRLYKNKTKNVQEAHEAIRPTFINKHPKDLIKFLSKDQFNLYNLIWNRTISSQMSNAKINNVSIEISDKNNTVKLRSSGSTLAFDGFMKLYIEEQDNNKENNKIPNLTKNEDLNINKITPLQHYTQPPPRYTEATLVKQLEELGIGRPSTYANIIYTLQNRNYVKILKGQFIPETRGRIVTTFLSNFFKKYIKYDFTAHLEELLDDISNGKVNWETVLNEFWSKFHKNADSIKNLKTSEIIEKLNEELIPLFIGSDKKLHACPKCQKGTLTIKTSKYGAFIGCSNYPTCKYTRPLTDKDSKIDTIKPKELGKDPNTGNIISLRKGPYGFYLQWDDTTKKNTKPKRISVPKNFDIDTITLETAVKLNNLPRFIGNDPKTKAEIYTGIGRFGPYIKIGKKYISLKNNNVLTIDLKEALQIISSN